MTVNEYNGNINTEREKIIGWRGGKGWVMLMFVPVFACWFTTNKHATKTRQFACFNRNPFLNWFHVNPPQREETHRGNIERNEDLSLHHWGLQRNTRQQVDHKTYKLQTGTHWEPCVVSTYPHSYKLLVKHWKHLLLVDSLAINFQSFQNIQHA